LTRAIPPPAGAQRELCGHCGNTLDEYIHFSGGRIARRDSSGLVYYYFSDHLGTTRVIANSSGTMCYDADYTPFGYEMAYTTTCTQNYRFTGLERDSETGGNDHTLYRQYEQNLGRSMSPDPLAGDVTNPQSVNRYAYVVNRPTGLTDPSGAFFYMCNPDQGPCTWWGPPGAGGGGGGAFIGPLWDIEAAMEAQWEAWIKCWDCIEFDPNEPVDTYFLDIGLQPTGPHSAGGSGINYFKLVLKMTSDKCDPGGRTIQYQLYDSSGNPVTSANFYVYEVQSALNLAQGGPFPGTTYQPSTADEQFNAFTDWINGLGSGSSRQQFGVSLQRPNASGVPGGHLVMVGGPGSTQPRAYNVINLSPGNPVINGTPCPPT
jgi:RHS repeat-associated protein